jgi:branched-chain amino acid transport system substrate-binding protein
LGVAGYTAAQALVLVLKQCGNDLSRDNIMKQAGSLHEVSLPMMLPGTTLNTSATERFPMKQLRLMRFNGERWVIFTEPQSG